MLGRQLGGQNAASTPLAPSGTPAVTVTTEPFATQGTVSLDRSGELISATHEPQGPVREWSVEWQHPVGGPIALPLTNLTDLGIID